MEQLSEWISIKKDFAGILDKIPHDVIIETLHADNKKDIARMINGQIYTMDEVTLSPITDFRIIR